MAAFAQSDRGTITGTISDPAGAVVPNAPVEANNVETSAVYRAASSGTGNYTLAELPTGTYALSVTATGFRNLSRKGFSCRSHRPFVSTRFCRWARLPNPSQLPRKRRF